MVAISGAKDKYAFNKVFMSEKNKGSGGLKNLCFLQNILFTLSLSFIDIVGLPGTPGTHAI